ncbi:trimeric intracellular cation channel family protein [Arachnia propionica]|uniref:trimeric intracellular cation channel family protein n=1 Tax=Arachnia propionica TaxID=1750 RepID=UPI00163A8B79|nr:trimeric intracellular cation channel family protein [Arachnia propionica]MDO5082109.1 trimeric intracellular cation channel family protein [Arachnia propionica]
MWDLVTLTRGGLAAFGIIAFAVSGALAAKRRDMDGVGIVTLACVTAVGGGVMRDLMMGAVPVAALVELWMIGLAATTGLVVMFTVPPNARERAPLLVFDAIGLGLFVVDGALRGLQYGLHPVAAALIGAVTGVGGGILRDVLASEVPLVFRRHSRLYVVPALLGGVLTVTLDALGLAGVLGMSGTAALVTTVRIVAIVRGWHASSDRLLIRRWGRSSREERS